MNAIRIETTIESTGNLHLTNLPFREGDRVEAVLQVVEPATGNQSQACYLQAGSRGSSGA
jgi:hypothetical protein